MIKPRKITEEAKKSEEEYREIVDIHDDRDIISMHDRRIEQMTRIQDAIRNEDMMNRNTHFVRDPYSPSIRSINMANDRLTRQLEYKPTIIPPPIGHIDAIKESEIKSSRRLRRGIKRNINKITSKAISLIKKTIFE